MPIYEYRRADGSTFELMQSFSDEPLTSDPETGESVQRVLHAPAVHFKGKGFYNTDYGTRKRQRESTSGDSGSTGSDKDASGGTSSGESSGAKSDTAKEAAKPKSADKAATAPAAA